MSASEPGKEVLSRIRRTERVSIKTGMNFYGKGIDFVKVDGQSAVPFYYKNSFPSPRLRGIRVFPRKRSRHHGWRRPINCMGMAMENVLARPPSAVSETVISCRPKGKALRRHPAARIRYNAICLVQSIAATGTCSGPATSTPESTVPAQGDQRRTRLCERSKDRHDRSGKAAGKPLYLCEWQILMMGALQSPQRTASSQIR